MANGPVSPQDVPRALVDHFLKKAKARNTPGGLVDYKDLLGIEATKTLIEVLEVIRAPTEYWNLVVNFTLRNINQYNYSFFGEVLTPPFPYVSSEVREQIVAHFVEYGDVDTVCRIINEQADRKVTDKEVIDMARYHYKRGTSSVAQVWGTLIVLATDKKIADRIDSLRDDRSMRERETDYS